MILIRPVNTIHHTDGGWFNANWHFSFDFYRDPENTIFGDLRVFNDDRLMPGAIWPMHPHRDIEGVTYVAEGTFEHADSMGNGGVLLPGSVQRATLGSGMQHSERNHSKTEPMRFIQMWILPAELGLPPSVEQESHSEADRRGVLKPVLVPAQKVGHRFRESFGGYLFLVHGTARVGVDGDAAEVDEGGAAKISDEPLVELTAGADGAELLLVETRLRQAHS
jgi:redox-sensitive bicupin YhaK (pirin superfamily)